MGGTSSTGIRLPPAFACPLADSNPGKPLVNESETYCLRCIRRGV